MKIKSMFIIILILFLVTVITVLLLRYKGVHNMDRGLVLTLEPTSISFEEYNNTEYNPYYIYKNYSTYAIGGRLDPQNKDLVMKLLNEKGINTTQYCGAVDYGSVFPGGSKFVFIIDSAPKDYFDSYPGDTRCIDYASHLNYAGAYIFDGKKVIELPEESRPIFWIDESTLLFEKTTSKFSHEKRSYVKTNFYTYNLKDDRITKVSNYDFPSHRKDISMFSISGDRNRIFFREDKRSEPFISGKDFGIIDLRENKTILIEVKECSKLVCSPAGACGDSCYGFLWSSNNKRIMYIYSQDYDDFIKRKGIYKTIDIKSV